MGKSKSAASGSRARDSQQSVSQLASEDARQRMIAEAAYYRALNRGFDGGDAVGDWLAAEREIGQCLPSAKQQREEVIVYEKLSAAVKKFLADAQDTVNGETVRRAFDKATEEIKKTGAHTAETVGKIAAGLRKDMASAAARMGPQWQAYSEKSADLFTVWRDRGNVFLSQAATAVGEWLEQTSAKFAPPTYRAGEMAASGTFECALCGERLTLGTSGHLPACPKCGKLEFRRI
jgi:hypothetical protein